MRGGKAQYFTIAQVADALRRGAGIPSLAAQILAKLGPHGCSAQTVRNYLQRYPSLKQITDETVETTLDLCESKILQAITDGEQWAIRLYVMTKGKSRGYTLRHEIGGVDGKPIEITDARDKLIVELDQMGERLAAANGELGSVTGRAPGTAQSNGAEQTAAQAVKQ